MLERPKVLVLAWNQQAALQYQSALQGIGYDVATISSTKDLSRNVDWRRFAAIVVANSFHEPEQVLSRLSNILDCPLQTLITSKN